MAPWRASYPSLKRALAPAILLDRATARHFGRQRGWRDHAFRRYRAARKAHLDLVPPAVSLSGALVVDVGANVGSWTEAVLAAEPDAEVLAVEPNPAARARLEARLGDDRRVAIAPVAVAREPGTVRFNLTGQSVNASLLEPRAEMGAIYGRPHDWEVQEVVEVEAATIDGLVGDRPVSLLKLDVQGAELDALAGATATLGRTASVLVEVSFVPHYEGAAEFADLHRALRTAGFELADFSRPFSLPAHPALWADACYVRRELLGR